MSSLKKQRIEAFSDGVVAIIVTVMVLVWFNMNLLFWMSLIPFVTAWMGGNHSGPFPVALYGLDRVRHVSGEKTSIPFLLYLTAIGLAYVSFYAAYAIYAIIPMLFVSGAERA